MLRTLLLKGNDFKILTGTFPKVLKNQLLRMVIKRVSYVFQICLEELEEEWRWEDVKKNGQFGPQQEQPPAATWRGEWLGLKQQDTHN